MSELVVTSDNLSHLTVDSEERDEQDIQLRFCYLNRHI